MVAATLYHGAHWFTPYLLPSPVYGLLYSVQFHGIHPLDAGDNGFCFCVHAHSIAYLVHCANTFVKLICQHLAIHPVELLQPAQVGLDLAEHHLRGGYLGALLGNHGDDLKPSQPRLRTRLQLRFSNVVSVVVTIHLCRSR